MLKMGDPQELGSLGGLELAIGALVGFGLAWQRQGHWWSYHRCCGVVCGAHWNTSDAQNIVSIAVIVRCRGPVHHPAVLPVPFLPHYASQPPPPQYQSPVLLSAAPLLCPETLPASSVVVVVLWVILIVMALPLQLFRSLASRWPPIEDPSSDLRLMKFENLPCQHDWRRFQCGWCLEGRISTWGVLCSWSLCPLLR